MNQARVGWLLVAIAALGGAALPARAGGVPVIRIWPDAGPPCDGTLQACIDAAGPGDQIRIATDGPILESIAFAKALTLVAESGYHPLLSSADGLQAATSASGDQTIRIEGLGFDQAGVGVTQSSTGTATVLVEGNTFFHGGGIGVGTNLPGTGPISFVVSGNTLMEQSGNGIAVGSNVTSMSGSIADNEIATVASLNYGILVGDHATVDVIRNRVEGNSHGIGVIGASNVRVLDNLLVGARGDPDALATDGIDVFAASANSTFATIVGDTIANHDRGIYLYDYGKDQVQMQCTIANDLITGHRIGVDNEASVGDPTTVVGYAGNLFFGNGFHIAYGLYAPNDFAIADPLYVSATDFHVQPGSPAIDAGDDASLPGDLATDLDGSPRLQGDHVDVGAYEAPEPGDAPERCAAAVALALCGASASAGTRARTKRPSAR